MKALVCAYPGDNGHPGGERPAGSRTLTDQAAAMARDLAYLPVTTTGPGRPCTLNSLRTRPADQDMCHRREGADPRRVRLVFDYPEGPAAAVNLRMNCTVPGTDNDLLQADLDDHVRDRILRLAPP